jgi:hypothetical protein
MLAERAFAGAERFSLDRRIDEVEALYARIQVD